MGRIKTQQIKRITKKLMDSYADEFTTEFSGNKEKVMQRLSGSSAKIRNIIAGYVTRLKKKGYSRDYVPTPQRYAKGGYGERYGDKQSSGRSDRPPRY
jgi:small subunit ribosomal protein S17e